ncbi:CocE/NonD family hydrolase [Catellatospora tritici]|uniref:CocE/NonD family hydrolase n=1 Tax=Catellatospora tritici TaxID=2851566 RepID=UPI001C2DD057|nr:CocE/NonD family hydrolase [Catellatospora tritici]MBV1851655.1 CocE/NonD family hydrolase [Catellatospora tritici]
MATRATGTSKRVRIAMDDGVHLAATLHLPATETPQPCLLEALPYRKDDLTAGYAAEYERLRDEFGYAVCRLDLRGTGSSEGTAVDEYPVREQDDLVAVIAWLAGQPWCDGNVGMYGTSYSGFNSIQVALRRPAALKAIVPIYATDDRYTDDVHFMGGSLRLLDVVDYPTYMIAMNALPPVPERDDWRERWVERIERTEPWLIRWLDKQTDGPYWRHGSLRDPYADDLGYGRITVPTMIVAGWADGYRNNSFRTVRRLLAAGTPARLLAGPWSHMSADTALPGPHLDLAAELARWFDRWLRGAANSVAAEPPYTFFVRCSGPAPAPDAALATGQWRSLAEWQARGPRARPLGGGTRVHPVRPDTGVAAWNSCAGRLPWGQPTDQRFDDAASLTWDWPVAQEPLELVGHAYARLTVAADQPVASVSVKLCDVAADGTSTLITRGFLNLTRRDGLREPCPLVPGEPVETTVEFEACAYTLLPGRRLRLSVTGTDWPNTVAPPRPTTLTVYGDRSELLLPPPQDTVPAPAHESAPAPLDAPDPVVWRVIDDVVGRTTTAQVEHGSSYQIPGGTAAERYTGSVSVDRRTWRQTARSTAEYTVAWPQARVRTECVVALDVTADHFDLTVTLQAYAGAVEQEQVVAKRCWSHQAARQFG